MRALKAEGVKIIFGYPGGSIMPTYDAISGTTNIREVLERLRIKEPSL